MRLLFALRPGRLLGTFLLTGLLLFASSCGDLAAALPERPTPVPTLARLPSVTPVTPSPTPSVTPLPTLTPTPLPLRGTVAVTANVRSGPGTDFTPVGVFEAGAPVILVSRNGDWFEIIGPGELRGWMFLQVLEIDPTTAAAVPESDP
ncbi:SH3 domain-containing protein [Candidatus Chloroploca asiatica]|uniref:SH3 domain-containing protein n=1 Tax=Candidatus Chloroploca asiatica TaxID=1506545 RepID=UPI001144B95A|nr:SH3 domain-containing protein [Candidatus Chloroploca asiatica]